MPVAYSYIRFSTPEQLKGDSLRRQIELSQKYADEHGLTLDTTLNLRDLGLSAYDKSNITKGALGIFLEAVKQKRIQSGSFLLVESLDRLSRDEPLEALQIFTSILKHGITIVTLMDRMQYNYETIKKNYNGLLMSIMIMIRAHEESATKSERVLAAWKNKKTKAHEKILTARCPQWMRLSNDRTHFELIPERVEVVKEIIKLSKGGFGASVIIKLFNKRKIPNFSNTTRGWGSSSILKILGSRALCGEFQMQHRVDGKIIPLGDPIPDYFPAIISQDEYFLLQNLRAERFKGNSRARKGNEVPNLFSGIAKCGYCGSTMIMLANAKNDRRVPKRRKFLACDGARRGHGCYGVQWEYTEFETSVLTFCRGIDFEAVLGNTSNNAKQIVLSLREQIASTTAEIEEKRSRMSRLLEAIELGGNTPSTVMERIKKLESEIEVLAKAQSELIREEGIARHAESLHESNVKSTQELIEALATTSGEERFRIRAALASHLRSLIEQINVHPAGVLHKPERIQKMRDKAMELGVPEELVEQHIQTLRTEPKRLGTSGRGRYERSEGDIRCFEIVGKHGGRRMIFIRNNESTTALANLAPMWSDV